MKYDTATKTCTDCGDTKPRDKFESGFVCKDCNNKFWWPVMTKPFIKLIEIMK